MTWFIPLLLAIAVQAVIYVLTPKPKQPKPPEVDQLENPTVDEKEIAVVFGTDLLKEGMYLWTGDKDYHEFEIDV